jgi:hypothetical protein
MNLGLVFQTRKDYAEESRYSTKAWGFTGG